MSYEIGAVTATIDSVGVEKKKNRVLFFFQRNTADFYLKSIKELNMFTRLRFFSLLLLCCVATTAVTEEIALKASQRIEIKLEDFPQCLVEMDSGKSVDKFATAVLPENYDPANTYPMLIFLGGGVGGLGNGPDDALFLSEKKNFIAVNLPLFKESLSNGPPPPIYINPNDFKHIAKQYSRILKLLREKIPNIANTGNVIGGFSNGAHTVGAIVEDKTLSKQFSHYILAEGGAEVNKISKESKAIVLIGEKSPYGLGGLRVDKKGKVKNYPSQFADLAKKKNVTFIVMIGFGHEFPEEYKIVARDWLKKEYPGIAK